MSSERVPYLGFTVRALSLGITVACLSCPAIGSEENRTVPKASCGAQDRLESVQGQITLAERSEAGPNTIYRCNLELIGQYEGEGTDADLEVFDSCAYYSTAANPSMKHPGVVVLDVSDSRHPKSTAHLASPAMVHAHKSLEISPVRKLLLGSSDDAVSNLDIYDISNCRHPVLKTSVNFGGGIRSHNGQFSADGLTFYGARFNYENPFVFALDVSDLAHLRTIATWTPSKDKAGWATLPSVMRNNTVQEFWSARPDGWDQWSHAAVAPLWVVHSCLVGARAHAAEEVSLPSARSPAPAGYRRYRLPSGQTTELHLVRT